MDQVRRRQLLIGGSALLAAPFVSAWGQRKQRARVGILVFGSAAQVSWSKFFLQDLKDLGWEQGRNLTLEWRSANGVKAKLLADAAYFAGHDFDLLVAATASEAHALQRATHHIPIVVVFCTEDPVGAGFAHSIARPGGDMTGVLWADPDFEVKAIQMVKEIVPQLQRIGDIYPAEAYIERKEDAREAVAREINVTELRYPVRGPEEIAAVLQKAKNDRVEALRIVMAGAPQAHVDQIIAYAKANRLPTIFLAPNPVERGGLMSYTPSFPESSRLAAALIDKILRGVKPGDLPFESVTRYQLVINLKTAHELGVTVPQSLLFGADRLIQ
jgi:putative ABC transport system substrate-binding protein